MSSGEEIEGCENITGDGDQSIGYSVAINILVFFTVWGISSVVDIKEFKKSFKTPAIYAGISFQFILMPFIGFITVLIFPLNDLQAVALLVLCASPGGSFSNWWCNLFNADLALSISMTSLSTVASIFMLPFNVFLYVTVAYQNVQEDVESVDISFSDLGITLGVVISGIVLGIMTGAFYPKYQSICNIIGNVAGAGSILLGIFASTDTCDGQAPWEQAFYPLWVATAFPLIVALVGVLIMGSCLGLGKPQRVAIALETAYQNTSISLAYTLGQGVLGRQAAAVPVIYGGYEAGIFAIFMFASWKAGWTYGPKDESIRKIMFQNWQPGGDNHKRLFPGYYKLKDEADEFNKSVRNSLKKALSVFGDDEDVEKKLEEADAAIEAKDIDVATPTTAAEPVDLEKVDEPVASIDATESPDSIRKKLTESL